MPRRALRALSLWTALLLPYAAGCQAPEPMPLEPSATWLVEAPPTAAGNPFEMVLFVRTPSGHRAHAYVPPPADGIEVVERRILPVATEGRTVVHREALLARARSAGLQRWPASEVRVTDADGDTYALPVDALEFDVPSVLGEGAPPRRPRGYRPAPSPPLPRGFGAGFAAGVVATAALAWLWVRRARRRTDGAGAPHTGAPGAARRYIGGPGRLRRRLEAAHADADAHPDEAAAAAALALRFWAADRFLVATHAASTEELRRARPDRASEREWLAWIDRLAGIERARFDARGDGARGDAVTGAIDAALELVEALDRPAASGVRDDASAAPDAHEASSR